MSPEFMKCFNREYKKLLIETEQGNLSRKFDTYVDLNSLMITYLYIHFTIWLPRSLKKLHITGFFTSLSAARRELKKLNFDESRLESMFMSFTRLYEEEAALEDFDIFTMEID